MNRCTMGVILRQVLGAGHHRSEQAVSCTTRTMVLSPCSALQLPGTAFTGHRDPTRCNPVRQNPSMAEACAVRGSPVTIKVWWAGRAWRAACRLAWQGASMPWQACSSTADTSGLRVEGRVLRTQGRVRECHGGARIASMLKVGPAQKGRAAPQRCSSVRPHPAAA